MSLTKLQNCHLSRLILYSSHEEQVACCICLIHTLVGEENEAVPKPEQLLKMPFG